MNKNVKNVLAGVAVLATGALVCVAVANHEKVKKAFSGIADHVDAMFIKYGLGDWEEEEVVTSSEEEEYEFDGPVEILPEEDEMATDNDATPTDKGDWGAT